MMSRGILLLGNYPPPYGGVPTHIMYLADHLAARGWNVHVVPGVVTARGNFHVSDRIQVHRPFRAQRLRAFLDRRWAVPLRRDRREHPTLRGYVGARAMLSYLKRLALEQNVQVISAYHVFGAATLGAVLSRELCVPMVTTIFGEIYAQTETFRQRLDQVREVAQQTAKWLAPSCHCARSIELLDLPAQVHTLHYGIDTTHFRPDHDRGVIRQRLGIRPEEYVAVFVGRMNHEMGLGVLLQAISLVVHRHAAISFLIVGTTGELTEAAIRLSRSRPDKVFVAPDVPYSELPLYYAAADFALAPSINERACLGLAIAEALATERPVIGCDVGGTREVLVDGMGMLIRPNDSIALADAIISLAVDRRRLAEMGGKGRIHVRDNFEKDVTNLRMEALLEQVIADATRGVPPRA